MSYFSDKLMYDFSLSSEMEEERKSGFKIKESSSSPLKGFWGSSFQKLQQMPLYSYQRMQQIIDMGSEPDLPPITIGSDEQGEAGLIGPTGPPGNIGPQGPSGNVDGEGATYATATFTFDDDDFNSLNDETITLIDAADTSRTYTIKNDSTADGVLEFNAGADPTAAAAAFKVVVEASTGHNGTITVAVSSGQVTMTQFEIGDTGNTLITFSSGWNDLCSVSVGENFAGGDSGVGSTGPDGFPGLAGNQGPIGELGHVGLIGDTGSIGYIGPRGPIGSTGPIGGGRTGDRGPRATGDIGSTCTTEGCTGPQGIEGTSGEIPCDCCIGITSQTNATCEIKVLAYGNIKTGPVLFDNFVLTNAGGVQKTFTATSGTQTHNNFKVQTSDEVTATNIKNMLALEGNESFTAAVTGDTVTVTQVTAGIEGNQNNQSNTSLGSISVTNFAGVRNTTWIKFPDPTYPGEEFDSEFDEQIERIMVGETHSFVLYFTHPTSGNKEIFWPLEGSYSNPDGTVFSDILSTSSIISKSQPTQHLSDYGTCGGFLAENVATEFTQNECEVLEAYRRGIGKGNTIDNRIDGYGVCGCNEEQLSIVDNEITYEGSADEFRSIAATYFNKFQSESEAEVDLCGAYSLWGKCGWGESHLHSGPNYANDFKTNSRGKFIIGYKTDRTNEPHSYEFWHGWESPSKLAETNTRNCQSCEGCKSIMPEPVDCCDVRNNVIDDGLDEDRCHCCWDFTAPDGGILTGCYCGENDVDGGCSGDGACCSDPGGEGDRSWVFPAPPGVNTDAACLVHCKNSQTTENEDGYGHDVGADCQTKGYHAQICETTTQLSDGEWITTSCANMNPDEDSLYGYPTIDLEAMWDGEGCPEPLACGLFACNGMENWGTLYDTLGNPIQTLQNPPMRMHNVEDAGCAMNSASCEQWQCCQSFSANGGDTLDYWRDHGPYGIGKNWEGGAIIPSNYGEDNLGHYSIDHCHGTSWGDENCNPGGGGPLDYKLGLQRGDAENDGYYPGEFLYRPGKKGHGNPIDYWNSSPCFDHANTPECVALCDGEPGQFAEAPAYFYLKYLISNGNSDYNCVLDRASKGTRPKCFIAPGEYTENDYLPNNAIYNVKYEPRKTFPTLVMNGTTIADKLKAYIDGGHLSRPIPSSLLSIDINVMVLTTWAVQTPANGTTRTIGSTPMPWTLKDPWPHLAPNHKKFNDYFNTTGGSLGWGVNVGGLGVTSWGESGATIYQTEKAQWHCRVGGVDLSVIGGVDNTWNNASPYSTNNDWDLYGLSDKANWDECDLCLASLTETLYDPSDAWWSGEYNTTHAGPRYGLGIPLRGYHGGFVQFGIHSVDRGPGVAIWDSLDNGVDNYQFHHHLNGVFIGNTASDNPTIYNEHEAFGTYYDYGQIRKWKWLENRSGPFKRSITSNSHGFGNKSSINPWAYSTANCYDQDNCRHKQISRMEEYLNDFFSLDEWTFDLDMNSADQSYDPATNVDSVNLSKEGWMEPSYITLTDYTINAVCIH